MRRSAWSRCRCVGASRCSPSIGGIGLLGMVIKLAAIQRLQWLAYALYPVMGWAAVVATPALRSLDEPLQIGARRSVAVWRTRSASRCLLLKRPDPWPRVFGYHEVWHGLHRAGGRTALRCRRARRVLSIPVRSIATSSSTGAPECTGHRSRLDLDRRPGGTATGSSWRIHRRGVVPPMRLHEILDGSDGDRRSCSGSMSRSGIHPAPPPARSRAAHPWRCDVGVDRRLVDDDERIATTDSTWRPS